MQNFNEKSTDLNAQVCKKNESIEVEIVFYRATNVRSKMLATTYVGDIPCKTHIFVLSIAVRASG